MKGRRGREKKKKEVSFCLFHSLVLSRLFLSSYLVFFFLNETRKLTGEVVARLAHVHPVAREGKGEELLVLLDVFFEQKSVERARRREKCEFLRRRKA